MTTTTKTLGRWGEEKAAEYLKTKEYRITGMNFQCRMGEIDVIAQGHGYLVFCEVKLRKSASFAKAREFVTLSKQKKIITAAKIYLARNPTRLQPRFDVMEIYAPQGVETKVIEINHIENAFSCE